MARTLLALCFLALTSLCAAAPGTAVAPAAHSLRGEQAERGAGLPNRRAAPLSASLPTLHMQDRVHAAPIKRVQRKTGAGTIGELHRIREDDRHLGKQASTSRSNSRSNSLTRSTATSRAASQSRKPKAGTASPSPSPDPHRRFTYYGGPLLQNIAVVPVFWNSNVAHQSELGTFYSALVSPNPYFGLLAQYSTATQGIGFGTCAASVNVGQSRSGVISDATLQGTLTGLIQSGALPAPTANTYYPIHFPLGVTISAFGLMSCKDFCGYHESFALNGVIVVYGVIPDMTTSACTQCFSPSFPDVEVLTFVSSHELIETVTDPGVGVGAMGWLDPVTNTELADPCGGSAGDVALGDGNVYVVSPLWSNAAGACVAS